MTYEEIFAKVKKDVEKIDASEVIGHYAFQFNITGEGAGIFYIEITDGTIKAEPYDYFNNNAKFTATAKDIIEMAEGKLDPITAFTLGRLKIDGNFQQALILKDLLIK